MRLFSEYVERLRQRHGERFTDVGLARKFRPYFGQRIEVRTEHGTLMRGWVSGTTGWQPALMLMKLRTSTGSYQLLSDTDELVRVIDARPRH